MTKISQLVSVGSGIASDDELIIRDVSDIATPNKKVTVANLALGLPGIADGSKGTLLLVLAELFGQ